jgi:hypothetical protein
MPLDNQAVDLILTSPPYINVFNYHQNCRKAMELLGWDLLRVSRSELGANRKHRANRFLTVVQYCMDMGMALAEFRRVLKPGGRMIVIMGRESCVRGVSFRNGCLVGALATFVGFDLECRQERKLRNKFGEVIFEDILHLVPKERSCAADPSKPTALAICLLEDALSRCTRDDIRGDLKAAIRAAESVQSSPILAQGCTFET